VTFQDLGSLAELIAALATVATLAYLAVQIRQNTRMVEASMADSNRDAQNELGRILGSNSEAARIYRMGAEDYGSLSPDELVQFNSLLVLAFRSLELRHEHGVDLAEDWFAELAQDGYRQFWKSYSEAFPLDFRRKIDHLMNQDSPAA
jgi:hypothetical protein